MLEAVTRLRAVCILITAMTTTQANDFDFLNGNWKVHNRYLKSRLTGSTEWTEFDGRVEVLPILGGLGNVDRFSTTRNGTRLEGTTLRLFNPATGEWSIYWVDNVRAGVLQAPMVGRFNGSIGEFFGDEEVNGKKVLCRFHWTHQDRNTARWEQAFSADAGHTWETNWTMEFTRELPRYEVIEFRRYTIREGQRGNFAKYFEAYFPPAIEQSGAVAFGEFLERGNPLMFTWMRGFPDMPARAYANQSLYDGPVWRQHRETMNGLMTDSDNVLLLRPLDPEHGLTLLPVVDPVKEPGGAKGILVTQIFAPGKGQVETFANQARPIFDGYRMPGVREAGVLVTIDEPNKFPRLPVRADGPFLLWFGMVENEEALERLRQVAQPTFATDLQQAAPEFLVLDPAPRSRLRWLPELR